MIHAHSGLSDEDLLVRYRATGCNTINFVDFLQFKSGKYFTCDILLHEWYFLELMELEDRDPTMIWSRLQEIPSHGKPAPGDLGIICCRPRPGAVPGVALLVHIYQESSDCLHSLWLERVRISLVTQPDVN